MAKIEFKIYSLLTVILTATLAFAQKGSISGSVIDKETHSPLVGVNVIVVDTPWGAATDMGGRYYIDNLPVGTYNLTFQMIGYETLDKLTIPVSPDRITQMDVSMEGTSLIGEEVVVTATAFVKARDAVVSDRNIDYTEMMRDPGSAMDVQRMMQALPAVVSGADQENEIIVRGGEPAENLFLLDNIEVPNPNHFGWQGTGGGPISMINPLFIREVDFYAGAFPARYGGKSSSAMDIHLREGNRERFHSNLDMGMSGIGLFAEGPLAGGNVSYMLGFHKSYLDLIVKSFGMTAIPQYYSLQGKVVWYISPKTKLIWNGIYGDDAINVINESDDASVGSQFADVKGYEYATGLSLKTLYDENRYSLITLSNVANYWDYNVREGMADGSKETFYIKDDLETEWTIKGDYFQRLNKRNEFMIGANLKHIEFSHHDWVAADTAWTYFYHPYHNPTDTTFYFSEIDFFAADPDTFNQYQIAMAYNEWNLKRKIYTNKYSLYGQFRWKPVPKITMTAGVRISKFDYSNYNMISPRFGFSYKLTPVTSINLGYGKHFQEPAYFLFTQNLEKNRDLKSRYVDQYVLGIEHLFLEDMKGSIEIYQKDYHQLPVSRSWVEGDSLDNYDNELLNIGEGFSRGVEFFLQKKLSKNFNLTLSYSHYVAKRKDVRKGRDVYYTADYDFRDVFTFISGYRWNMRDYKWYNSLRDQKWWKVMSGFISPGDEFEISVRWRYMRGKPFTKMTYDPYLRTWYTSWNTDINTERLPEYHRLDIQILRRWMFKSTALVVYFDIMNIYNRNNIWSYIYNPNGTRSNIYQFSLFPVGGFVLEF